MLPDRVSNPGPLTYESGALPIANNLSSTCKDNATYKVSRSLVYWFWRRRFFKVFTIYGHSGHVGHVTQLICINFHSYSPSSFHMNFGSKSPDCFC